MQPQLFVNVILPVHNPELSVGRALAAIHAQAYPHCGFIVVDRRRTAQRPTPPTAA
jgi:hypothetical protein